MFESHSQAVGELLRERRLISTEQLAALQAEHRATGVSLADLVLQQGWLDRGSLLRHVAEALGSRYAAELPGDLPEAVRAAVPPRLARDYGVLPVQVSDARVELLAVDPFSARIVEDLSFALRRDVQLVVGDPAGIAALIRRVYGVEETSRATVQQELHASAQVVHAPAGASGEDLAALAGQPPVVRLVNQVLAQAIRDQASDVHFEPFENAFRIRYRVDGALCELAPAPAQLAVPVTSRIKVLADLDIAERRVPQDGRMRLALDGRAVDLRVSTLPTQFGESVVLRVLDRAAVHLELGELGLPADVRRGLEETIRRPSGILIVTGPTGSGKTTTLYSALRAINTTGRKLLTAEDPVEYEIEGVTQVPVNPAIGLTFASALRGFLRQDPDVIMVGEIRDLETAQIAIQAALTGHLVLTTLHTNDAAGAVTRLVDLGVEPFLLASTLEGVLAQRLVRRVCPQCRAPRTDTPELRAQLGDPAELALPAEAFVVGRGCAACGQTGYHGRMGVFEWLRVSERLRELIVTGASSQALRAQAILEGMHTLRGDALRALAAGATTVEEVARYT